MLSNPKFKKVLSVSLAIIAILGIHYLIMNLYIFIAVSVYGAIVGRSGDAESWQSFISSQAVIAVIVAGVVALLLYVMHFNARKQSLWQISRFRRFKPIHGLLGLTAGMSAVFLSGLIVQAVAQIFPGAYERFLQMVEMLDRSGTIPLVIAVVIVAPFIEEVMFRGLIFRVLEQKYALLTTVLVQGLLFGAYHMNVIQGAYAAALGVLLGLSLIWTGSIWIPIIVHFGNNLMSTVLGLEPVAAFIEANEIIAGSLVMVMLLVVFPLSIYGLYRNRVVFAQDQVLIHVFESEEKVETTEEDAWTRLDEIDKLLDRED
ncbi:MAG: CPBP family intramembrane metalloprotease [Acholeplasmatales bacterium]|nr:MAG: CPBP family intramembrane metalloprotease [Acholeplasmatales bacterium]